MLSCRGYCHEDIHEVESYLFIKLGDKLLAGFAQAASELKEQILFTEKDTINHFSWIVS